MMGTPKEKTLTDQKTSQTEQQIDQYLQETKQRQKQQHKQIMLVYVFAMLVILGIYFYAMYKKTGGFKPYQLLKIQH